MRQVVLAMLDLRESFVKIFIRCLFLSFPLTGWSHQNIDKIPLEDRERLERLFDYLIQNSSIGYTLCGEKPVSIENTFLLGKIPPEHFIVTFNECHAYGILCRGGDAWDRYSHLFSSKNFVLRYISDENMFALINIKATRKVIEENLDLFQKYTNSKQTAQEFLNEVCFPKDKEYLGYYNESLLGILLGYGRNNAVAFFNKGFIQKLEEFSTENYVLGVSRFIHPGFVIINNGTNEEENKKVKKTFKVAKRNMLKNFKEGNPLDNFIRIYCN